MCTCFSKMVPVPLHSYLLIVIFIQHTKLYTRYNLFTPQQIFFIIFTSNVYCARINLWSWDNLWLTTLYNFNIGLSMQQFLLILSIYKILVCIWCYSLFTEITGRYNLYSPVLRVVFQRTFPNCSIPSQPYSSGMYTLVQHLCIH